MKAIGLVQTAALPSGETSKFGVLMEDGCYAPNHQHFFCARLDMNLDGPRNQVVEVNTTTDPMGPENPRGNAFYTQATVFKTELEAGAVISTRLPALGSIQNPNSKNRMGSNVGYKLSPMELTVPYWQPESPVAGAPAIWTITSG